MSSNGLNICIVFYAVFLFRWYRFLLRFKMQPSFDLKNDRTIGYHHQTFPYCVAKLEVQTYHKSAHTCHKSVQTYYKCAGLNKCVIKPGMLTVGIPGLLLLLTSREQSHEKSQSKIVYPCS